MTTQTILFAALIALACARHPLENVHKMHNMVHAKDSKQLLNCMARCVDRRLSQELEKCEYNYPIGPHSGIHGGTRRRIGDHLVTMSRDEMLRTVNCISQSGDRIAQNNFDLCSQKFPEQTYAAVTMCSQKITGATSGPAFFDAMAARPITNEQIYECTRENTVKYTPKEANQVILVENCIREGTRGCGGQKSYH